MRALLLPGRLHHLASFRPLRLFSLRASPQPSLTSVVVRAQRAPAVAHPAAPTVTGFAQLGLGDELLSALAESRLAVPTEIQAAAIPEVLKGGDMLLASHTGSGKTLAYLLPLVKLLRDEEAVRGAVARARRPRALVLGPTRELTDQILHVAKSLSHHARFRSICLNAGVSLGEGARALDTPVDVVVGTPSRILSHLEKGHLAVGDVRLLVLDEADTMFDQGFGPEVRKLLGPLRSKAAPASCVLVAATLTKAVRKLLEEELPSLRRVETASLHRGVAGARHSFMAVPPGTNKLDLLLTVVEGEAHKGRRVMVFANTLDSCRAAEHHLAERGLATLCYHGDVPLDERRTVIQQFSAEGQRAVLVCTDLAARGLDVPGRVDHVVNFDFPMNPVDYLHRTGRTARAGATGRVTSLVATRDRVLAQRIEAALAANAPLDGLTRDRKVLPDHMRPKKETLERKSAERKAEAAARRGVRGAARAEMSGKGAPARSRAGSKAGPAGSGLGRRKGVAVGKSGSAAAGAKGGRRQQTAGSKKVFTKFK